MDRTMERVMATEALGTNGNVVDSSWHHFIRRKTDGGRSVVDPVALLILAEIVWRYRPREVRPDGGSVRYVKKFNGDKLMISYRALSKRTGFSRSQIARAIKLLRELGIIETEKRTVKFRASGMPDGIGFGSFMFVELNPWRLGELMTQAKAEMVDGGGDSDEIEVAVAENLYQGDSNLDGGGTNLDHPPLKFVPPSPQICGTNKRLKERVEERVEERDIERPALRPRPPGGEPANGDNGKAKDPKTEEARLLVDQLNELLHGGRLRALDKLRQKARARLNKFTSQEILEAARKCKADPFMSGQNDSRKVYATAEYILRNDLNVEKWLHAIERKRSPFDFGDGAANPAFTFGGY